MKPLRLLIVLSIAVIAGLYCSQPLQPKTNLSDQYSVYLAGRVLSESGNPVTNVVARINYNNLSDTTDANGYYCVAEKKNNSTLLPDPSTDTLQYLNSGHVITMQEIPKWIDTLPDVRVIQHNISGSFLAEPNAFGGVEATVTVGSDPTPRTVLLWYNEAVQEYSGFIYVVFEANQTYSIYVSVYNTDSLLIGLSTTLQFPYYAGAITLPAFDPNNATPSVFAGNDTSVSINDTIRLRASAVNLNGVSITKWEWSFNGGSFVQTTTGDTNIIAPPDSNPNYVCVVRMTDNDSLSKTDTMIVNVVLDPPVAEAGNDTAVYMNYQVALDGKASQQFGTIVKWEWNIGNGGFKQTSTGDTTITTPDSSVSIYPCVLKVTDDDENSAIDTVVLQIGEWELVGNKGFSDGKAFGISFAISNDTPYVAYCDSFINGKATAMSFNGVQWLPVGNKGFSDGSAAYLSLAISNGTPYVAYCDDANNGKATVMSFNGVQWLPVGNKGFSDGTAYSQSLSISNGTLYVAYEDEPNNRQTTVMKFDGVQWVQVGKKGFSDGSAHYQSLVFSNGIPYVAYTDEANGGKITVMHLR